MTDFRHDGAKNRGFAVYDGNAKTDELLEHTLSISKNIVLFTAAGNGTSPDEFCVTCNAYYDTYSRKLTAPYFRTKATKSRNLVPSNIRFPKPWSYTDAVVNLLVPGTQF